MNEGRLAFAEPKIAVIPNSRAQALHLYGIYDELCSGRRTQWYVTGDVSGGLSGRLQIIKG